MDQVIAITRALKKTRASHHQHHNNLNRLATALLLRFDLIHDLNDLDEALSHFRDAVNETPWGHPDRAVNSSNLAAALHTRFEHTWDPLDLNDAIFNFRAALEFPSALELVSKGPSIYFSGHTDLANALLTRFDLDGSPDDLNEAIDHHQTAHGLAQAGHPDLAMSLNNLAGALLIRFEEFKEPADIEEALANNRTALSLTPDGHPDRHMSLENLANALLVRFEACRDPADLENAVSCNRRALELTTEGHPDRFRSYISLANSLLARFKLIGDRTDLGDCVRYHRCAILLMAHDHPDRPMNLKNFASALLVRFENFRDSNDLEEAFINYRLAVDLKPTGSSITGAGVSTDSSLGSPHPNRSGLMTIDETSSTAHSERKLPTPNRQSPRNELIALSTFSRPVSSFTAYDGSTLDSRRSSRYVTRPPSFYASPFFAGTGRADSSDSLSHPISPDSVSDPEAPESESDSQSDRISIHLSEFDVTPQREPLSAENGRHASPASDHMGTPNAGWIQHDNEGTHSSTVGDLPEMVDQFPSLSIPDVPRDPAPVPSADQVCHLSSSLYFPDLTI